MNEAIAETRQTAAIKRRRMYAAHLADEARDSVDWSPSQKAQLILDLVNETFRKFIKIVRG